MFASKARTHLIEATLRYSNILWAPYIAHKHQTKLERSASDEHSSTLRAFVNYDRKKLCIIGARLLTLLVFLLVHSGKTLNSES